MKGGKQGALCCEHEVDPYDPDQRPHKERSSVQALSASVRVGAHQSGQRKALRQQVRAAHPPAHRDLGASEQCAERLGDKAGNLACGDRGDDSLLQTAVSVCLAENQDKRKMLHVVTHPSNMQWLSN